MEQPVRCGDKPRRPNQIDDSGKWGRLAPVGVERDLVGYAWLGRPIAPNGRDLVVGQMWVVTADLVAEADPYGRPRVSLRGLRSSIRHAGRPVERDEVAGLEGYSQPLMLIPEGARVELVDAAGSVDWNHGGYVCSFIQFRLPGGATFELTTTASLGDLWVEDAVAAGEDRDAFLRGMGWSEIACAAVVVPASHPTVTDPALRDALLARIEAAAGP
jgi:hypothetical protein